MRFFLRFSKKHPYKDNRVILVADPFSNNTFYYEFNIKDILSVDEQPRITNINGESVSMVRIWVKKKSIGLQCMPFTVGGYQLTPNIEVIFKKNRYFFDIPLKSI